MKCIIEYFDGVVAADERGRPYPVTEYWVADQADDLEHALEQLNDAVACKIEVVAVYFPKPVYFAGMRVMWNDPDEDNPCSGPGTITNVHGDQDGDFNDSIISISKDDGGEVEAFAHELEVL